MNSLYKFVICAACLAILANAPIASAQGNVEGVWKIVEMTSGPNGLTNPNPQPGLYIFTKSYYSLVAVDSDKPRTDLPAQNATDAQKIAAWTPFAANAGTYEIKGNVLTMHPVVAMYPNIMKPGSSVTSELKIEGNALWITTKALGFKVRLARME
jgi:hypothetical protein